MAALPYMQLYVADYLADTSHLTVTEHGAYLLLMFNYWQRGQSFKAKDQQSLNKRLATVARMSNEEWADVAESLAEFFNVSPTEWEHKRIARDLQAVHLKSTKASTAGKASAASKRAKKPAVVPTNVSTSVEHPLQQSFNHTDTDTDTDTEAERELYAHANELIPLDGEFQPESPQMQEPGQADPQEDPGAAPFAMFLEWKPARNRLGAMALRAGLSMDLFDDDGISGFVIHHQAKGLIKAEDEWLAALVGWRKRDYTNGAAGRAAKPQGSEDVDFDSLDWLEREGAKA
ncbi:hypothetical protein Pfra02_04200 [Pseudomonas fragi]|nr:hypothetical protein Pfra02_04200 [Pseudomonas fragi]